MSSAPLSDDLGRRAGFPWYYPVVFLLNLTLILTVQLLAFYTTALPMTEESLAKKVPAYADAVIVNSTQNTSVSWYLAETDDGTLHLIPVQRNQIRQDRGRILFKQIVTIPADTEYTEIQTKVGIGATTVTVGTDVEPWEDEVQEHPVKLRSKYAHVGGAGSEKYTFTLFIFLALAMSIGESILWNKIKNG